MHKSSLTVAAFALVLLGVAPAAQGESVRYLVRWVRELGFDPIVMPVHPVQRSRPAFSNSEVVVGTRQGQVRAYDRSRGSLLWSREVSGAVEADVARIGTWVYAGTVTGSLYALAPSDGSIYWRYGAGHEILGAPTGIGADLVAFATANNQVFAVRVTDGSWAWQYNGGEDPDLSIRGVAGLTVSGGDVFTGFSSGEIARIDGRNGQAKWVERRREDSKFNDIDSTPVVAGNRVYAVVFGSRLVCLKTDDGVTVWTAKILAREAPALAQSILYVGGLDGTLRTYRAEDGQAGWAVKLADAGLNQPVVSGRTLYVAGHEGGLWGLDPASGEIRMYYKGGVSGTQAPVLADEREVYLTTNLGHLIKLSPMFK